MRKSTFLRITDYVTSCQSIYIAIQNQQPEKFKRDYLFWFIYIAQITEINLLIRIKSLKRKIETQVDPVDSCPVVFAQIPRGQGLVSTHV